MAERRRYPSGGCYQPGRVIDITLEQLYKEEDQLSQLKEGLDRSRQQKESMLGILDSFQKRLGNLDATVLPLYEQTGRLQRRQQNIGKLLKQIDATISFYSTANEMDATIRDTHPSDDLEKYLARMGKLREAMKFFATDRSYTVQLESSRSSFDMGCSILEREFRDVIVKSSNSLKPQDVIDLLDDNFEVDERRVKTTECVSASAVARLKTICEWLLTHTGSADFLAGYSDTRSPIMLKTLQRIAELRKTMTVSGAGGKDSPKADRKATGAGIMKGAVRKFSTMAHSSDKHFKRTNTTALDYTADLSGEKEADNFLTLVGSFNALFQIEQHLMARIVGNRREESKIQRALIIKPLSYVIQQGETMIDAARKGSPVLGILPAAKYLHAHQQQLDALTKVSSPDLHSKFIHLVKNADGLCQKGLEDFVEMVKSDQDKFIPKDGTVHQVTSNTLSFLKQLMDQKDAINLVLCDATPGGDPSRNAVPKLFARILSALGLCLRNKAENYVDEYLKAIFMLNNYNHIYKTLQESGILKVVCEQNREVESYYLEQVHSYKNQYLRCWERVASTFIDFVGRGNDSPVLVHNMGDREKDALKQAFSNFNRELEHVSEMQGEYSVPDQTLSAHVKRDAKEILVSRYHGLFSNYKSSAFSRNPEKYVRYTPEKVASMIDRLFDTPA